MDTTEAHQTLDRFRREVYHDVLGRRKDSAFELMEAALVADGPRTLVRRSLEPAGSWALPLDERRRGPASGSPTDLLLAQLGEVLPPLPAGYGRPVVTADSGYDAVELARVRRRRGYLGNSQDGSSWGQLRMRRPCSGFLNLLPLLPIHLDHHTTLALLHHNGERMPRG